MRAALVGEWYSRREIHGRYTDAGLDFQGARTGAVLSLEMAHADHRVTNRSLDFGEYDECRRRNDSLSLDLPLRQRVRVTSIRDPSTPLLSSY